MKITAIKLFFPIILLISFTTASCGLMDLPTVATITSIQTTTLTQDRTQNGTGLSAPNFIAAVEKIKSSVVTVETELAVGTGWIITADGLIVTNNHVIEDGNTVTVTLDDGRQFIAQSVDVDLLSDLAIIRIDATGLPAAEIGTSSSLKVGEPVAAVGNALGEGISMKGGWVSRLNVDISVNGQTLYGLLETDAAINEGNSGGPLVNLAGQVVGITNAKLIELGVEGIGYAISIDSAVPVLTQLINSGRVIRPFLGVGSMQNVANGVYIGEVISDTPAAQAGLVAGDIVTAIDGVPVANFDQLFQIIQSKQVGQTIKIDYLREGSAGSASAVLAERP